MCCRQVDDVEAVVKAGNCAGCGLCESMAGRDSIEMKLLGEGRMRPVVKQPISAETNNKIMTVCPGKVVTGPSKQQLAGSAKGFMHPVFGPLRTWYRGWAADTKVRWRAAAGGCLTTMATHLLETGQVQKVVQVRANKEDPTTTDAIISDTKEGVLSGCQSRYGPAAPLVHVMQLLDEGVTFCLVGKPCDVSAVRALGKIDPRVEKQIPYMISIFCGGLPSRQTVLRIAKHHGVEENEISVCRYRGHGWPGLMTIGRKSDGKEFGTSYCETWKWILNPLGPKAGIEKYDMQWRCKVCPDAIGEMADVSCPDGWLFDENKKMYVSQDGENPGQNLVLVRTAAGEKLVNECFDAGKLCLAPLEISELEEMHRDHWPRKCTWPLRLLAVWLSFQGGSQLTVNNYRPFAGVWWSLMKEGWQATWSVFRGTLQRARAGMNIEKYDKVIPGAAPPDKSQGA